MLVQAQINVPPINFSRMRIAVVHDWLVDWEQEYTWRDGLSAAIRELINRGHEVRFWSEGERTIIPHPYFPIYVSRNIVSEVKEFNPDVILCWADCTRPNAEPLSKLGKPMALCFSGGSVDGKTSQYFDHFFVESGVYYDRLKALGRSVSRAFGVNTDIFKPIQQPKYFDTIFPATFAAWKRHLLWADAMQGLRGFCFGYMYDTHERWCYEELHFKGVMVAPHLSAEATAYVMNSSHSVLVTSDSSGGSQRTVLEAMACNIPVVVMADSDKCREYVEVSGFGKVVSADAKSIRQAVEHYKENPVINSRDWVLENYSHIKYADQLEEGLRKLYESSI